MTQTLRTLLKNTLFHKDVDVKFKILQRPIHVMKVPNMHKIMSIMIIILFLYDFWELGGYLTVSNFLKTLKLKLAA